MSSRWVYWTSDGGGKGSVTPAFVTTLYKWIMQRGNADLIVYGGDIYNDGTEGQYAAFLKQITDSGQVNPLGKMCSTAGNHDWHTLHTAGFGAPYPEGYETFWTQQQSLQPVDATKKSGARYEHFIDLNGWRLIFLDTGPLDEDGVGRGAWPMGDQSRALWLDTVLNTPTRTNIIFAHHSRLSCGNHGDNPGVQAIWRQLFDNTGQPRAVFTVAGHDHNVSVYKPRGAALQVTGLDKGVQIIVNGAGGTGLNTYAHGTPPDAYPGPMSGNSPGYCVTQIELIDAQHAHLQILSFGLMPNSQTQPQVIVDIHYPAP